MRKKEFCVLILMIFSVFMLSGCKEDNENLELQKGLSEVRFLENQCITIFNKYITDDYFDDKNQIDWNLVNEDYAVLKNSIDVILIDFSGLQIPSKNIVELENNFEDLENLKNNKDLDNFMKKICDSYMLVSNSILDSMTEEESIKLEKRTKSYLLYIGYYIKALDKENALYSLDRFQEEYSMLNINKDYLENNSYKVNRIFINIQRLKTLLIEENFKDGKELFLEILDFF